jgi:transposase
MAFLSIIRRWHKREHVPIREISDRLGLSKTTVATYQLRAREAGLNWPLTAEQDRDEVLKAAVFGKVGRPPRDLVEPDWPHIAVELKRPGVTLILLWQEYRESHPDGFAVLPDRGVTQVHAANHS